MIRYFYFILVFFGHLQAYQICFMKSRGPMHVNQ